MTRTRLLTLAASAALATLPAGAQVYTTPNTRILRAPRAEADFGDENRAAIGVSTTATGTLRDTLGLMITMVTRGGPAERAGLEEGNRIQAINNVNLRANAADIEDVELSGSLSRRLTRELAKAKPGDEIELRVYKEGRAQTVRVKTVASDSLFRGRDSMVRFSRADADDRPALGFSIQSSGSRRDTLGVLIVAVGDSTPAERAGLEEGNRIAAINGVNLRVAREDAGDSYVSSAKAQRLQRELSQLKPGSDATLRVYSNGQYRDVHVKVARAGDLPRRGRMYFGGVIAPMPPMPPMPAMPAMPDMRGVRVWPMDSFHLELGPELEEGLHQAGVQLERIRPQLDRVLRDLPATLESIQIPEISVDVKAPRMTRVVM